MDLILRNCKLSNQADLKDIGIAGEKIVAVEDRIPVTAAQEIDARSRLTAPAFIDPHIHLDKTLITDVVRPNLSGTLQEAIEIIWEKKARYTVEDIVERAGKTIMMAARNGTTRMRTHVDVDTIGGLTPLKGLLEARERYRDIMDIEIVAFPQEGILKDPGCEDLMWKAMELGADVVGGMPANEFYRGPGRTALERGEILRGFSIPRPPDGSRGTYLRRTRVRGMDLAGIGLAALAVPGEGRRNREVRLALGAVTPTPWRARGAESLLKEQMADTSLLARVKEVLSRDISPRATSLRASPEYKREMAGVLLEMALARLLGEEWAG